MIQITRICCFNVKQILFLFENNFSKKLINTEIVGIQLIHYYCVDRWCLYLRYVTFTISWSGYLFILKLLDIISDEQLFLFFIDFHDDNQISCNQFHI